MARKIHPFSLALSPKTCYEFLVSTDAVPCLWLHRDHPFFPLPLKICCGSAPRCRQYSVPLKSLPVQISSSRERKTAAHTWIYFGSCSTVVVPVPPVQDISLLHLPSRFLQRKDAQTGEAALRVANSPLWRWSRVWGANQQPAFGCAAIGIFSGGTKDGIEVPWTVSKRLIRAVAVPSDLDCVPGSIHCGLLFVTLMDVSPLN